MARTTSISLKKLKLKYICSMKLKFVNGWQKKMKRFNTITYVVDRGLIRSTVITGGVSIGIFSSGGGPSIGNALSETNLLYSLAAAVTRKLNN